MRPQVGQVINNKYRLLRIIGDGGMGSVYEARHELLGTTVALKFLHPELSRRSGLVQRFMQEARVSAQIQSPHVVRVIDVDQQSGGLAYIVMEYLEGKTLQTLYEDLYRAGQRLSYADAIEYAMQMLEGVEAAHAAGIVHRDLKPDNVIITKNKRGEPLLKLLDFGIAKLKVTGQLDRGLTRPGVVMGTPEYMAPEQAYSADAVDATADIFSLGVMVFEMLAGRRPVGGDDPHQIATSYMTGQISRLGDLAPHLAPELAVVVHRAIAPVPKDRYPSVADFRSALEPFAVKLKGASPTAPATPVQGASTPSPAVASPVAAATPPASSDPDRRSIPKTLPPEDEAQPARTSGVHGTSLSEPPDAAAVALPAADGDRSSAAPRAAGDTPPGEVSVSAPTEAVAADAQSAGLPATVSAAPFDAAMAASPGPRPLAPTEDAAPYLPRDSGAAQSTSPGEAPIFDAPMRASGTAVAAGPYGSTAPAYPLQPYQMGVRPGDGTMPMDPIPAPAVMRAPGKKQGGGSSFVSILLIASGITAMVLGGLYVVQNYTRQGTSQEETQASVDPPPSSVSSDPGPTIPPTSDTTPAPLPPPPQTTPAKPPPQTTSPKPPLTSSPTSTPTATPTASHTTTIPPPIIPTTPWVIPSQIPGFPLPGGGSIPPPTFPGSQPTTTTPPTNTSPPTTTSTGRPKIPRPKF